jgi:hypothetical protein
LHNELHADKPVAEMRACPRRSRTGRSACKNHNRKPKMKLQFTLITGGCIAAIALCVPSTAPAKEKKTKTAEASASASPAASASPMAKPQPVPYRG